MKETFDELIVMLDEMKRAAIHACDYYSARNYQRITSKVVVLQAKYNEGLQKEPVAAKNTEMTALEYCLKGGTKMDAVKFLKERKRMCDSYPIICGKCKISEAKDGLHCYEFQYTFPERAVAIVEKWSEEHPQKTIKDDFFEKFPNANKLCDGIPDVCAAKLGYVSECTYQNCEDCCKECWNEPLDEVK